MPGIFLGFKDTNQMPDEWSSLEHRFRNISAERGCFFHPDTAVATPDESHAGLTWPWQDQTLLMRESHGRGWAARLSFEADTAVATPNESHAGRTRLWQGQTVLMRESHGRGGTK